MTQELSMGPYNELTDTLKIIWFLFSISNDFQFGHAFQGLCFLFFVSVGSWVHFSNVLGSVCYHFCSYLILGMLKEYHVWRVGILLYHVWSAGILLYHIWSASILLYHVWSAGVLLLGDEQWRLGHTSSYQPSSSAPPRCWM